MDRSKENVKQDEKSSTTGNGEAKSSENCTTDTNEKKASQVLTRIQTRPLLKETQYD